MQSGSDLRTGTLGTCANRTKGRKVSRVRGVGSNPTPARFGKRLRVPLGVKVLLDGISSWEESGLKVLAEARSRRTWICCSNPDPEPVTVTDDQEQQVEEGVPEIPAQVNVPTGSVPMPMPSSLDPATQIFMLRMLETMDRMSDKMTAMAEKAEGNSSAGIRATHKPKSPTPFRGTGKGPKVKDFVMELDMYFLITETVEEKKTFVAGTYLIQDALVWWTTFQTGNPEWRTMAWEEWKEKLTFRFTAEYHEMRKRVELNWLKQTGSVISYIREFASKLERVSKMDEFLKCSLLIT
ncbi:hypothetical protein R1sor_000863 [Riccia sorocarpa]|uniref:Ty3 transposon capsid-like protein domain-containing protein n=1 Tax=Riccia sorocarpa TaxID=122646 RepID=A0ABD3GYJ8_9MARC